MMSIRSVGLWAAALSLVIACAAEDEPISGEDAGVDAAIEARSEDARVDAAPERPLDGSALDARAAAAEERNRECMELRSFETKNGACTADSDCIVVGFCENSLGVRVDAGAEATRVLGSGKCRVTDGLHFDAVCEQGQCRRRPVGQCGGIQIFPDGGSDRCAAGSQYYATNCGAQTCERRCSGPDDTSCGPGQVCSAVFVAPPMTHYLGLSAPDVSHCASAGYNQWLCRPQ